MTIDWDAFLRYAESPAYLRRWAADMRRDLTTIEMLTNGCDDADYAVIYSNWLRSRMGDAAFTDWLQELTPPWYDMADNQFRRALFGKLQEVMR